MYDFRINSLTCKVERRDAFNLVGMGVIEDSVLIDV